MYGARKDLSRLAMLLVAMLSSVGAWGADWKVNPRLGLSESYSDNLNLRPAGQENSAFITKINPGVTANINGAHLKANVDYSLQAVLTTGQVQRNRGYHQLNATANAELVDESLYLDARALADQQNISLLGPLGVDNTTGDPSNITTKTSYSLSPYLRHKFGSLASGEARVTHDKVSYTSGNASDSTSNAVGLKLNSGTAFYDWSWGLNYNASKIKYSEGQLIDRDFEKSTGTLGYRLTPKFRVFATAGHESNTFPAAPGFNTSGPLWTAGFGWSPTTRTAIEASYGHRFFGKTFSLDLNHRTRLTVWNAQYNEDITDARTVALRPFTGFLSVTDPTGQQLIVVDSTGKPIPITIDIPVLTNDTFISKRFTASVGITRAKSTVSLSAFNAKREYLLSGESDRQYGGAASWALRLSPRMSSTVSAGWSRVLVPASLREDDLWNVRFALTRDFNPKLHGSVELRHQERNSNQATSDYKENAITALINMSFQ